VIGIVVAVVVAVVLVALALRAFFRRGGDEAHSVDNYRHTLHTLSDIQGRSTTRSVRVIGQEDDPAAERVAAGGESSPPAFEDAALRPPVPPARDVRRRDRAMASMNHGPRRVAAPLAVGVVVLAALAAVVVVGARSQHHKPSSGTGAPSSSPTTTTRRARLPARQTTTTTTTTTTVPSRFVPLSATSLTATYRPPATTYSVTLATTTSECWVTVSSSSGASIYSETMSPGQTKALSVSGATTVIIGAPSALAVTVDHEPVVLPTGYGTPFTMTLQPAAT
jgi:hypothetical protein